MTYQCWNIEETDSFDIAELLEGYSAGRKGDPQPAWPGNRSQAYVHGWHTGARDAGRIDPAEWMQALVKQFIAREKEKKDEKSGRLS